MLETTTFRPLVVSAPTFSASPSVAKATVYMPSHVAARILGGRAAKRVVTERLVERRVEPAADASNAA